MSNIKCGDKVVYWDGSDDDIYVVTMFDIYGYAMLICNRNEWHMVEGPTFENIRHATKKEIELKKRINYI